MGIEIIHDQRDLLSMFELLGDFFLKPCPILLLSAFGYLDQALAHQRFSGNEYVTGTFSGVFVIKSTKLTGLLAGIGILVSAISCLGDSSMQMTGYSGSYGCL